MIRTKEKLKKQILKREMLDIANQFMNYHIQKLMFIDDMSLFQL
jgi:hypothetical protein